MKSSQFALITGGSSGLGYMMAKVLIQKGYTVFLIARNLEKLKKAQSDLGKNQVFIFQADVCNETILKNIYHTIKEKWGYIDFLILNAGIGYVNTLQDSNIKKLKQELDINLWGAILTTKIFLPLIRKPGKILFISSAFGLLGGAGYSVYCASKSGMIYFAESLRRELLSQKIRVYVACPADIDTPMYREEQNTSPEWLQVNQGRMSVMSAEIAAKKILKRCKGDRFLILINFEIFLFHFLSRFLPIRIKNWLIDIILPRP